MKKSLNFKICAETVKEAKASRPLFSVKRVFKKNWKALDFFNSRNNLSKGKHIFEPSSLMKQRIKMKRNSVS